MRDRLLWRELSSQAYRRYPREGWTYPGASWFLTATLLPPAIFWKLTGGASFSSPDCLAVATVWQTWLLSLRSATYPAVSMAYDFREGTLPVLRATPIRLVWALTAKLIACLLPLWMELGVLLPVNLLCYGLLGDQSPSMIVALLGIMGATSLFFGGFGLWLGSVVGDPERVSNSVRLVVSMLLLGTPLLAEALTWPLLLVGGLIWLWLVAQPQARPGQAYQGGVAALILLLLLPVFYTFAQNMLGEFELSAYNPLVVLYHSPAPSRWLASWNLVGLLVGYTGLGAFFGALTAARTRAQI